MGAVAGWVNGYVSWGDGWVLTVNCCSGARNGVVARSEPPDTGCRFKYQGFERSHRWAWNTAIKELTQVCDLHSGLPGSGCQHSDGSRGREINCCSGARNGVVARM